MTEPSPVEAKTVRRTLAGAALGGVISAFCGCPVSIGIGLAVEIATASIPFSGTELGALAGGGLLLSGIVIGAGIGYLARDLHWEDLR